MFFILCISPPNSLPKSCDNNETFNSEMKEKKIFLCISLTYFVTLHAEI